MNNPARILLDRLEGLHQTGNGQWLARCPAHDDRHPSLSIGETDDGRVLVHCFAGCDVAEVMAAVGLGLADLFPDDQHDRKPTKAQKRHFPRDVLRAVADEALVVLVAAEDTAAGKALSDADRERLVTAKNRLRAAAKEGGCDV